MIYSEICVHTDITGQTLRRISCIDLGSSLAISKGLVAYSIHRVVARIANSTLSVTGALVAIRSTSSASSRVCQEVSNSAICACLRIRAHSALGVLSHSVAINTRSSSSGIEVKALHTRSTSCFAGLVVVLATSTVGEPSQAGSALS